MKSGSHLLDETATKCYATLHSRVKKFHQDGGVIQRGRRVVAWLVCGCVGGGGSAFLNEGGILIIGVGLALFLLLLKDDLYLFGPLSFPWQMAGRVHYSSQLPHKLATMVSHDASM